MVLRAFRFVGLAFAFGAVDFRFFADALVAFDFGGTDFALPFVTRLLFALGAADFRFLAGAFVVLF